MFVLQGSVDGKLAGLAAVGCFDDPSDGKPAGLGVILCFEGVKDRRVGAGKPAGLGVILCFEGVNGKDRGGRVGAEQQPGDGFGAGGKDPDKSILEKIWRSFKGQVTGKKYLRGPSLTQLEELAKALEKAWKTGAIKRGSIALLQKLEEWFKKRTPTAGPEQDNVASDEGKSSPDQMNGPGPDAGEKPGPDQKDSKRRSEEEEPEEPNPDEKFG